MQFSNVQSIQLPTVGMYTSQSYADLTKIKEIKENNATPKLINNNIIELIN